MQAWKGRGLDVVVARFWLQRAPCTIHQRRVAAHGHPGTVRASNYIQTLRFLLNSSSVLVVFFLIIFAAPEKINSLSLCPQAVP
jgi:hypothetical protein